ncbi:EamA domain-containing membrane protein RarD [Pustulibacterium marinum]|uniref:EamA domain-containing membrane protein RarD n=1 Tax=Pustulibacterium marinum TaxID=1224947 RepID=A0A1I7FQ64_9FLAO|nr:DMT family transporter [Pustulibacterium marinum]SFU38285.1 EamA domain-containing membrane protein RarD [Pustulibacterium marinum]
MQNDKLKNYLHLHLIVFIWGFTAVLGALISIDALPLVWYRMLLASMILGVFVYSKKKNFKVTLRSLLGLLGTGGLIALHWITFFGAIKVSNVSVTLACVSTGAFFTAILEPLIYRRKIIWYEIFFGLLAVVGLYVIFNLKTDYTLGIVLALVAAFLAALFSIINGKFSKVYDAGVISFYELLSGALLITLYFLVNGNFTNEFFDISFSDIFYLFLLASVCTAYAFMSSVKVMRFLSPYTVMLTTNLEPIYGILLAYFILGDSEKMSFQFYVGAFIILSTVIANGVIKNRKKRKSTLKAR